MGSAMKYLQGFRTVGVGLAFAVAPNALEFLLGVDPVQTFGLSGTTGMIVGAAMVALRAITKTPMFRR